MFVRPLFTCKAVTPFVVLVAVEIVHAEQTVKLGAESKSFALGTFQFYPQTKKESLNKIKHVPAKNQSYNKNNDIK